MMVRVLFVCLGNICRSPTAEGVFSQLIHHAQLSDRVRVDSAGTGGWHKDSPPDPRAVSVARAEGYDLSFIRSRQITSADFAVQDMILAMDNKNHRDLQAACPLAHRHKLYRFLDFAHTIDAEEVPDPYSDDDEAFVAVLHLIEQGSRALLAFLRQQYEWPE